MTQIARRDALTVAPKFKNISLYIASGMCVVPFFNVCWSQDMLSSTLQMQEMVALDFD